MQNDEVQIARNCACTQTVLDFVSLGESLAEDHDSQRFWTAVAAMASKRAGLIDEQPKPKPGTATDKWVRAFGRKLMPFGKHQGKPLSEVPLDYLKWLVNSDNTQFTLELVRYVESDSVQREIQHADR